MNDVERVVMCRFLLRGGFMGTWYLLFNVRSPDGMGESSYISRTSHKEIALKHFKKVASNPYSTGKVMIANDFEFKQAVAKDFLNT